MTAPDPRDTIGTGMALIGLALQDRPDSFMELLALTPKSEWQLLIQALARTAAGYARHLAVAEDIDEGDMADIISNVRTRFLTTDFNHD